jgi:hypothetical protein
MTLTCPLGHTCESCLWNIQMRGQHPQTGQEIDQQKCAMQWIPILLIEVSRQTHSAGAAIESFRNEVVRGQEELEASLLEAANQPPLISRDKMV